MRKPLANALDIDRRRGDRSGDGPCRGGAAAGNGPAHRCPPPARPHRAAPCLPAHAAAIASVPALRSLDRQCLHH